MSDKDKNRPDTSAEDKKLWDYVSKTITPLYSDRVLNMSFDDVKPLKSNNQVRTVPTPDFDSIGLDTPEHSISPRSQKSDAPQSHSIDKRTLDRLKKGKMQIDRTLDMHGMTQETAHNALRRALMAAHKDGLRLVLVVTGKGQRSSGEGGILRRRLKEWCELSPLSDIVLQIHNARPKHGGGGAFYVYLRRKR